MKEIKIVKEQKVLGKDFRVYGDFDNPLFLAKDVSDWIEHNDMSRMMNMVDEDEKLKRTIYVSGQNREMWLITEEGLYEILMQSRKPIAKEFKKEVKKILKDVRRHGMYAKDELLDNPDLLLDVVTKLKYERDEKEKLRLENEKQKEQIIEMKPKVEFTDTLLTSENSILIRQFSKVLERNGIKIGQNKLFEWFVDNEYLMKNHEPYQKYVKYFTVIERAINTNHGVKITFTTKINPKGQYYFYKKIKEYFNEIGQYIIN